MNSLREKRLANLALSPGPTAVALANPALKTLPGPLELNPVKAALKALQEAQVKASPDLRLVLTPEDYPVYSMNPASKRSSGPWKTPWAMRQLAHQVTAVLPGLAVFPARGPSPVLHPTATQALAQVAAAFPRAAAAAVH